MLNIIIRPICEIYSDGIDIITTKHTDNVISQITTLISIPPYPVNQDQKMQKKVSLFQNSQWGFSQKEQLILIRNNLGRVKDFNSQLMTG